MEPKKNPKINLERNKTLFFQIGLFLTLITVLIAIEWEKNDRVDFDLGNVNYEELEEEIIPITQEEIKPPPPPPHLPLKLLKLLKMKLRLRMRLKSKILNLMKI